MLSIGDGQQGFKLEVIEKDEEMIAKTLSMAKASDRPGRGAEHGGTHEGAEREVRGSDGEEGDAA